MFVRFSNSRKCNSVRGKNGLLQISIQVQENRDIANAVYRGGYKEHVVNMSLDHKKGYKLVGKI